MDEDAIPHLLQLESDYGTSYLTNWVLPKSGAKLNGLPNLSCISVEEDEYAMDTTAFDHHQHLQPSQHRYNKIDGACREKMCVWMMQICDHFSLTREIAGVAIQLLDRFMSKELAHNVQFGRREFQLACMVTLSIAVKIHCAHSIHLRYFSMESLEDLSDGYYSKTEIIAFEKHILFALNWRLYPPTTNDFTTIYLQLIPQDVPTDLVDYLNEVTNFLVELAVCNADFITVKRSRLALGAILKSMENVSYYHLVEEQRREFHLAVYRQSGINTNCSELFGIQSRLHFLFAKTNYESKYAPNIVGDRFSSIGNKNDSGRVSSSKRRSSQQHYSPPKGNLIRHKSENDFSPQSVANNSTGNTNSSRTSSNGNHYLHHSSMTMMHNQKW